MMKNSVISNKKLLVSAIILLVVIILLLVHWFAKPHQTSRFTAVPITVGITKVSSHMVTKTATAIGNIVAKNLVDIKAQVAGNVTHIYIHNGENVKAGQLLMQIDDSKAKANLAKARYQLDYDKTDYYRVKSLMKMDPDSISKADLDNKFNLYHSSLAAYQTALNDYDNTRITAPFDGILGKTDLSIGSYVSVGDNVINIVNPNKLEVQYNLPSALLEKLQLGQIVNLTVDVYPQKSFAAKVDYISPTINDSDRSVTLRASITNSKQRLRVGELANVTQILSRKNSLTLPGICLLPQMSGYYVYIVKHNKASRCNVTIAQRVENNVVIKSGLHAGQVVICPGQDKVKDGSTLQIVNS